MGAKGNGATLESKTGDQFASRLSIMRNRSAMTFMTSTAKNGVFCTGA